MQKHHFIYFLIFHATILSGCIGTDILDDTIDSEIIILNPVQSIQIGTSYPFMAEYRNMAGMPEDIPLSWDSSNDSVIRIDSMGIASAIQEGESLITVMGEGMEANILVMAGESTAGELNHRTATLVTSSSYPLSGTASLTKTKMGLLVSLDSNFRTTSALPGLYIYLSNNVSTTNNAYEIGRVNAFSGAQQYVINDIENILAYKYILFFCKPFVVPVGHGELNP